MPTIVKKKKKKTITNRKKKTAHKNDLRNYKKCKKKTLKKEIHFIEKALQTIHTDIREKF
jgi:hypothetical protein